MKHYLILFVLIIFTGIQFSCEDLASTKYKPELFVEGYMIVDEPINNLIIQLSQPTTDSFDYYKSHIKDAKVIISTEDDSYELLFNFEDSSGYYYPNQDYLVEPKKTYNLDIILQDGTHATGSTTTPAKINWVVEPKEIIYYPLDTLEMPADPTLNFEWSDRESGFNIFYLKLSCLDTVGYGKYIDPPTEELNRRIERPWSRSTRYFRETTLWMGPMPVNYSPVVWNSFKWFGKYEIEVYSGDVNFMTWLVHYQRFRIYNPLLSSMEGAIGTFGSAAKISKEFFVFKNQP